MRTILCTAITILAIPGISFGYEIPQSVLGTGGVQSGSANFGIRGTAGQPAIGAMASASFDSRGGYWYNPGTTVTAIDDGTTDVPRSFSLDQNYPNPFNPTTTIQFALPATSMVTLQIYDASGRLVVTLLSKDLPAGVHKAVWDAVGMASGVYFYRLRAEGFVQTRKLVLLK